MEVGSAAKKCVTTYLPNATARKMDGASSGERSVDRPMAYEARSCRKAWRFLATKASRGAGWSGR